VIRKLPICSESRWASTGDQWDDTSANSAEGYGRRSSARLPNGMVKREIGHHIVRNNTISDCGQTGLWQQPWRPPRSAPYRQYHPRHSRAGERLGARRSPASKFHRGPSMYRSTANHIYRTPLGLWLDWMAQGGASRGISSTTTTPMCLSRWTTDRSCSTQPFPSRPCR